MSGARRRLMAALLAIGAVALAGIFIEYRIQPIHACPGSHDFICLAPHQIVSLGYVDIDPAPGSDLARYHGKTNGDRGLYSRFDLPVAGAVLGGILLPILMLITAIVLVLRRTSTNQATAT